LKHKKLLFFAELFFIAIIQRMAVYKDFLENHTIVKTEFSMDFDG